MKQSIYSIIVVYRDSSLSSNQRLWRYMGICQYLDLLHTQTLYFSSINRLKAIDAREGAFWDSERDLIKKELGLINSDAESLPSFIENSRGGDFFVNCWHMNEVESMGMWDSFGKHIGIAVVSNVTSLDRALGCTPDFVFRAMRYAAAADPVERDLTPFLKTPSFSYERELRILADILQSDESARIPVEVATLVEEVRVHPDLPEWQLDSIRNVTRHYGFEFRISASSLSR